MSWDVCRICLSGGVKMYSTLSTPLLDIYEKITSGQWNRDSRPYAICYICYSQLKCSNKLRVMSIQSEEIFAQLFAGGFEFTEETVPILNKRKLRKMSVTPVESFTITNNETEFTETYIKQENDTEIVEDISIQEKEATNDALDGIIVKQEVIHSPNKKETEKSPNKKDVNGKKGNLNRDIQKELDFTDNIPIKHVGMTYNKIVQKDTVNKEHKEIEQDTCNISYKKDTNKNKKRKKVSRSRLDVSEKDSVEYRSHENDINERRTRKKTGNCKTNVVDKINKHNGTNKHSPYKEDVERDTLVSNKNITKKPPSNKENKKSMQLTESLIADEFTKQEDDIHELSNTPTSDDKRVIDKNVKLTLRFSLNNGHSISQSQTTKRAYPFDDDDIVIKDDDDQEYENLYSCELCTSSFKTKSSLKNHQKSHVKRYACDECPKKFHRSGHLSQHLRSHRNEKPYHCEVCDKRFVQLGHLQQHSRIHTGETPYPCDLCDKKFKQKSNLLQHKRSHINEKPYCCEICQKSFTQLSNLKQHKLKNHNEE